MTNPAEKIEQRPIAKLVPYARNSRTHSDEQVDQIAASIREWGWTMLMLIDTQNNIIAGHGRYLAAQKLGMSEVPVVIADGWSDEKKRAYIIADNKLALNAGWDNEMLALEFVELEEAGFDLNLTGFSEDEIQALMPEEINAGLIDEDDAPGVSDDPITVPGDIWTLGKHRLMCGDATIIDDIQKLTDGNLVDLLITDPPYNVDYKGGARQERSKIKNDAMDDDSFVQFLRDSFVAADSAMKPGAVFYIWHANIQQYNFLTACKQCGWSVRQCLIWIKSNFTLGRSDYHWKHEPCLYGWKDGANHLWASDRKQTTILEFNKPQRSDEHPTMKPVALFEYKMLNNTKGGDIVLDIFGGSGTTLIAAEKHGRVARLMEIDPKYCDVIIKRWQEFAGKKAVHAETGQNFGEHQNACEK